MSEQEQHTPIRRRLLLGLAGLAVGGTFAGILAYHHEFQLAPLWYNVIGVNVSNHQGDIDWLALARSNVAFTYIKATEGGDFRDKRFQLNWEGSKRAGAGPRGLPFLHAMQIRRRSGREFYWHSTA